MPTDAAERASPGRSRRSVEGGGETRSPETEGVSFQYGGRGEGDYRFRKASLVHQRNGYENSRHIVAAFLAQPPAYSPRRNREPGHPHRHYTHPSAPSPE